MKIHEYQAKALLARFGVPTPAGFPCFTAEQAVEAARRVGGTRWVVKAQVHAGGRGLGGGVKLASSLDEVRFLAGALLGQRLATPQTPRDGWVVKRLLVEQAVAIERCVPLRLALDRRSERIALTATTPSGARPKALVHPFEGLADEAADAFAREAGFPAEGRALLQGLARAFDACDALLAEVDAAVTADDRVVAIDARLDIDPNALFRHPELVALRDDDEEDPDEVEASRYDLAYIALDGNIGCLVNGAGLAMATLDLLRVDGGAPANFLDVGGDATADQVSEAFQLMMRKRSLKAILVNIFGGIMRCDVIAAGIVDAARRVELTVPLIVRLTGTNEEQGLKVLKKSGLPVIAAHDMADAAVKAVRAAAGR